MVVEGIRSDSLDYLRTILVKSLSSENVGRNDMLKIKQYKNKVNPFNNNNNNNRKQVADKIDHRLRNLKERQNEERQKKLEEIKAQALAAQRFKEQKELERRKRIDELKGKDDYRRQQVEERKRAIIQAEQDRLISILKRNQEREVRFEAKRRNEKSNIVFAFGSSTPRMLDPHDLTTSFWGTRRATSIQNITSVATNNNNNNSNNNNSSLTRRQSERDLDSGSKKRATSASGLERSGESSIPLTPAGCVSGYVGRRRTDLMPTIPSKDSSFSSSTTTPRKSLNHSPGRAYSMTRLDQLAKPRKRTELPSVIETTTTTTTTTTTSSSSSYHPFRPLSYHPRQSSITRSMSHLAVNKNGTQQIRKQLLNKTDSRSMHQLSVDGPLIAPRTTRATQLRQHKLLQSSNCSDASSRPSSSLSQQSTTSVTSSVSVKHRPSTAPRRQRPASIAITGITYDIKTGEKKLLDTTKPPLPKTRKSICKDNNNKLIKNKTLSPVDITTPKNITSTTSPVAAASVPIINNKISDKTEEIPLTNIVQNDKETTTATTTNQDNTVEKLQEEISQTNVVVNSEISERATSEATNITSTITDDIKQATQELIKAESRNGDITTMVTTTTATTTTVTTNEIKEDIDALSQSTLVQSSDNKDNEMSTSMTKPRITTEEEAKAALAERRRLAREEAERQAEQERLRIEAERLAELEKQRLEEEQVQKLLEQQRIAEQQRLEEAIKETKRREEEERLRKEEELRAKLLKEEADRKAKEEAERKFAEQQERLKNEEKEREARRKRVEAIMRRTRGVNSNNTPTQQNSEDKNENNQSENKMNGTNKQMEQDNVTKNGKDIEIVDNLISNDTLKNANTVSVDTINSTDSINSNNTWQTTQQYDPLM